LQVVVILKRVFGSLQSVDSASCVLTVAGTAVSSRGQTYRGTRLSSAAQTHLLHKLHTPSRCVECDRYVYFQGAECELVTTTLLHSLHSLTN